MGTPYEDNLTAWSGHNSRVNHWITGQKFETVTQNSARPNRERFAMYGHFLTSQDGRDNTVTQSTTSTGYIRSSVDCSNKPVLQISMIINISGIGIEPIYNTIRPTTNTSDVSCTMVYLALCSVEWMVATRPRFKPYVSTRIYVRMATVRGDSYAVITITVLDIIHRPVFYLKHNVLQTGFCLRAQLYRFHLKMEIESSLRNFMDNNWIISRTAIVILTYHRHKPIDRNCCYNVCSK
jgi:hypothetical protein